MSYAVFKHFVIDFLRMSIFRWKTSIDEKANIRAGNVLVLHVKNVYSNPLVTKLLDAMTSQMSLPAHILLWRQHIALMSIRVSSETKFRPDHLAEVPILASLRPTNHSATKPIQQF